MSELFNVSASPHVRNKITSSVIMRDVLIALMPTTIFGIFFFGVNALLLILTTCTACVLTEYLYEKAMKKPITVGDYSALVTGLLLALNFPSTLPLWMAILGGVFAILIVKQFFGGLGQNFMNPALAARCFLHVSFAGYMNNFKIDPFTSQFEHVMKGMAGVDGITSATPLATLRANGSVNIFDMFVGTIGGTIGETSALAILIGGIYLAARKVISLRIPLCYIGSFIVFMLLFSGKGMDINYITAEVFGGGLLLGAIFMATDYVTSPITPKGKIYFGIALGVLTAIFRLYGPSPEGVSYSIIICNLFVPLIERITIPKPFGMKKES